MRRLYILIVFLVFSSYSSWAADKGGGACDTCADTNWSSCTSALTQTGLQQCFDNMASGATITLPAGTLSADTHRGVSDYELPNQNQHFMLHMKKAGKLIGAGKSLTTITTAYTGGNSGDVLLWYGPQADVGTTIFEMSNLTIDASTSGIVDFLGQKGDSTSYPVLKVHDINFNNGVIGVVLYGLEKGVFYSNVFTDNSQHIRVTGAASTGWSWNYDAGSENYVFFEDNIFNTAPSLFFETGSGGRLVFRYNTATLLNEIDMLDIHGKGENYLEGQRGSVAVEVYNNTFHALSAGQRLMFHRGGRLLMFNNTIDTNNANLALTEYGGWYFCLQSTYPATDQIFSSYYYNNINSDSSTITPFLWCGTE